MAGRSTRRPLPFCTIGYYCIHVWALRSGHEHRRLCLDMLCLVEPRDDRAYIEYTEHGSKNNPGGLKQRKCVNKTVRAYANIEDPSRCFIRLYKYYMSLRPENAPDEAFYLQPERTCKWTTNQWYRPRAMGHNSLCKTVKQLRAKAGIEGFFTNHSLRRSCASRLFQEGAEEHVITSVTGHRSVDGVRSYKMISDK